MAAAGVYHAAGDHRRDPRAVRLFPDVDRAAIPGLLKIYAHAAGENRKSPHGPAAADLRRPVWLERDDAGGGRRVPQAAAGGAKVLRHLWAELRRSRRHRFLWPRNGIAARDCRASELFLL